MKRIIKNNWNLFVDGHNIPDIMDNILMAILLHFEQNRVVNFNE